MESNKPFTKDQLEYLKEQFDKMYIDMLIYGECVYKTDTGERVDPRSIPSIKIYNPKPLVIEVDLEGNVLNKKPMW